MIIRYLESTVFMVCLLAAPGRAEFSPNIKIDPDIDNFIYRLCSRYDIGTPSALRMQPVAVSELRVFLQKADSLDRAGKLTEKESFLIEKIRREIDSHGSLYSWQHSGKETGGYLHLSLLGEISPACSDKGTIFMRGTIAPEFKGYIRNISIYTGLEVSTDYMSDSLYYPSSYEPYDGVPYTLYGRAQSSHFRATHVLRGGIRYERNRIILETALDRLRLGPCVYSPLTLSGDAPPLTWFRGRLDMGKIEYMHLFGLLKCQADKQKYIYAHRLDIPFRRIPLQIGVNEVIITGSTAPDAQSDSLRPAYYGREREWEWVYMIPFLPFSFAEQYIGDRDNAALSFDFNLLFPRNFRWYGELFLDDITAPWTIFSNDWGNKWAFTVGGQFFGVLFSKDIMAILEYSRVEPWVYTHFYGGSHRYTHFDQSLGASSGPNADALHADFEIEVSMRNTLGMTFANLRNNSTARGGSIEDVYRESAYYPDNYDVPIKQFLGPGTSRNTQVGLLWKWNPFGLFRLETRAGIDIEQSDVGVYGRISGGFVF